MIDYPRAEETDTLVALAKATGFFNPEELEVVRELLVDYFTKGRASGYDWSVYREQAGAPPLGFVCYGPVPMSEDVYDLYWIAVDPGYQGKQVGSQLLKHAEEELKQRNARQLYIETSDMAHYAPTRAFYKRKGYEEVAHFTDFYHVGDGKVVFRKVFREK